MVRRGSSEDLCSQVKDQQEQVDITYGEVQEYYKEIPLPGMPICQINNCDLISHQLSGNRLVLKSELICYF